MSDQRQRHHVLEPFLARTGTKTEPGGGVAMEVVPYRGYFNLRGDPGNNGFLESVHEALGQPLPVAANTFTEGGCRVFWLGPNEWLVMTEPAGEEPSAGEREGAPLAGKEPSAGEREGAPLANKDSAGQREGAPLANKDSAGQREQTPLTWNDPLTTRLADALADWPYALTDLTGGQICIRLSGRGARDVLAKGCTLDLHPRAFQPGQCAQTVLGKASMLIARSRAGTNSPVSDDAGSADDAGVFDIVVRRTFAEYAADWLYRSAEEYGVRVDCHG